MSADIDSVRAFVDRLASQGVEYAVGLYPFIYSSEELKYRNVTATLEPAFGSDVAKRVYSELADVFKGINMYAQVEIEGWKGSLKDYL